MKLSPVNPTLLPQAPEAEHSILCSILERPKDICTVVAEFGLKPEHFHIPSNRLVFQAAMELYHKEQDLTHITITQRLKEEGTLKNLGTIGVFEYLDKTGFVRTHGQLQQHLQLLDSCLKKRNGHLLCLEYGKRFLNGEEAENLLAGLIDTANGLSVGRSTFKSTKELTTEIIDDMIAVAKGEKKVKAQRTGITELDKALCGGMRETDFVLISAPTKGGKSILAHNIAQHAACEEGKPVLMFSLEMRARDVVERMVSSVTRTDFGRMRNNWLNVDEILKMKERIQKVSRSNLVVRDDIFSLTRIEASIRQFKNIYPDMACAIVDYAQLIEAETTNKFENREGAVARISTTLRRTANQLHVPIILLSQENDDGRARESRRLEQDCTTWIKLSDVMENNVRVDGIKLCEIKLNRNGPPTAFHLTYLPHYLRLENHRNDP